MKTLILSGCCSVLTYLTFILIGILIADKGGAILYGDFSVILVLSVLSVLASFLIDFGSSQLTRHFLPKYFAKNNSAIAQGLFIYILLSTLIVFCLCVLISLMVKYWFEINYHNFGILEYILIPLIAFFLTWIRIFAAYINCRHHFLLSTILYKFTYPLLMLIGIFIVLYLYHMPEVKMLHALVKNYFASITVTLLITSILTYNLRYSKITPHIEPRLPAWIKGSISYTANSLALYLSGNVSLLVLQLYERTYLIDNIDINTKTRKSQANLAPPH